MNGRYLLDTNVVIAIFAREKMTHVHLEKAKEVFVPSIVLTNYITALKNPLAWKRTSLKSTNLHRLLRFLYVTMQRQGYTDT